jgi:membrane-associated phospholipid phosphatase
MKVLLTENIILLIVLLIVIGAGYVFLGINGKINSHLIINGNNNAFQDFIMPGVTMLGDGLFMVIVAMGLILYRIKITLILISSFLSTSILVQSLKHLVFSDFPRPVRFFEGSGYTLKLIEGMHHHSYLSFPSGHSATAFALFIGLALMIKSIWLKMTFLFLAVLVAFSRVYLSQHFLNDILAGAIIGSVFAFFFHNLFTPLERKWLNFSLINLKPIKK